MFQINRDGFIVDEQGLPANKKELLNLTAACAKTLALGEAGREALARRVCEKEYPSMAPQIDFAVFA